MFINWSPKPFLFNLLFWLGTTAPGTTASVTIGSGTTGSSTTGSATTGSATTGSATIESATTGSTTTGSGITGSATGSGNVSFSLTIFISFSVSVSFDKKSTRPSISLISCWWSLIFKSSYFNCSLFSLDSIFSYGSSIKTVFPHELNCLVALVVLGFV